jgi:hypothetical protein
LKFSILKTFIPDVVPKTKKSTQKKEITGQCRFLLESTSLLLLVAASSYPSQTNQKMSFLKRRRRRKLRCSFF